MTPGAGGCKAVFRIPPKREALLLSHPLPVSLLCPAELLGLPSWEEAVRVGVVQEKLDCGLDVLHEVRWLSQRGRRQILQYCFVILCQPEFNIPIG